jgi:hypothetical protein
MLPWSFQPLSPLRQCCAKHHQIGQAPHTLSQNMTSATATTMLFQLTAMRQCRRRSFGLRRKLCRSAQKRQPCIGVQSAFQVTFFVRQSDKFIVFLRAGQSVPKADYCRPRPKGIGLVGVTLSNFRGRRTLAKELYARFVRRNRASGARLVTPILPTL